MTLDASLFHFFNNLFFSFPALAIIAVFFAHYFPYLIAFLSLLVLLIAQVDVHTKARHLLSAIFSIFFSVFVFVPIIRIFIERPRPFVTLPSLQLLQESSLSFPSVHATIFFAIGTSIFIFNKRLGVFFLVSAVLISVARVMVGIHYPGDILGGAILGIISAYASYRLFKYLIP
jgi:undecaprenyl-diphosphatase